MTDKQQTYYEYVCISIASSIRNAVYVGCEISNSVSVDHFFSGFFVLKGFGLHYTSCFDLILGRSMRKKEGRLANNLRSEVVWQITLFTS